MRSHEVVTAIAQPIFEGATTLDAAACGTFAMLFCVMTWKLVGVAPLLAVPSAALAYPATDLLSGVVHWAADSWGSAATPIIGPKLIVPFREHHRDPLAITSHGFVAANGASCLLALPVAAAACLLPVKGHPLAGALLGFFWGLLLSVALTNQIHVWVHVASPPRPIAWLQRHRLILGPAHHDVHHTGHVHNYCITSGWLDAPLERLQLFRRAEKAVTKLTGRRPVRTGNETAKAGPAAAS